MPRLARMALLALVAIAFWEWRIIAPASPTAPADFVTSDLYTQYIPVFSRAVDELRSGHLPLWNPDQLAGVPVIPTWFTFGVFSPLNALYFILPTHLALGWSSCLHLAIAGGAMYWLASVLGLSAAAAWFAAVTYMLSRFALFEPNLLHAMALAPAVIAAWIRLCTRPQRRALATAALLTALQLSSGGTQLVVHTAYAIALLLPFVWRREAEGASVWRTGRFMLAAAALAVGLVAVVLLPTAEMVRLSSRRPGGLTLAETVPLPTPTAGELLHQLLSPAPALPRAFFGWSALLFALIGVVASPRRRLSFGVLLIAGLGAVLVLGPNTPLYGLYYLLPTGNWFRVPQRFLMLMGIGVALLAAIGVDYIDHTLGWRRLAVCLAVLPAIELFHATWNIFPHPQARPAAAVAQPAAVAEIKARLGFGRAYVVRNWQDRFPFMEKFGTWCRLPVAQDYDSLTPAVYGDYFRALLDPSELIDPMFGGRYHPFAGGYRGRRALDMLAVRLLVAAPGTRFAWANVPRAAPPGREPLLIENDTALPRAYFVHHVEVAADERGAQRRVAQFDFQPASTAVVIGGRALDLPAGSEREWVEVVDMTSEVTTLRVFVEQPGLLVLTDLLFRGWEVAVDSVPAEMFKTNLLFRGVYLDAGEHRVTFRYRSWPFRLGAAISAVSGVALLLLLGGGARRMRKTTGRLE